MPAQQFTPWQKMRAYETQVQKLESTWAIRLKKKLAEADDENTVTAVADCPKPFLTYYNNGKENVCCKTAYDYNYGYCEGYDQSTHRCDRKHPNFYMRINLEEEYPCRAVPLLGNSNYGHRPPIDPMQRIPKKKAIDTFYRNHGTAYCINANGYDTVKYNPTWSFRYNQAFGYTYSPPK